MIFLGQLRHSSVYRSHKNDSIRKCLALPTELLAIWNSLEFVVLDALMCMSGSLSTDRWHGLEIAKRILWCNSQYPRGMRSQHPNYRIDVLLQLDLGIKSLHFYVQAIYQCLRWFQHWIVSAVFSGSVQMKTGPTIRERFGSMKMVMIRTFIISLYLCSLRRRFKSPLHSRRWCSLLQPWGFVGSSYFTNKKKALGFPR